MIIDASAIPPTDASAIPPTDGSASPPGGPSDLSPADHLRTLGYDARPDAVLDRIEEAGATQSQATFEAAFSAVFSSLDGFETRLQAQRFLAGPEAGAEDWRLFVVLVRFDAVYRGLYRLNRRRVDDYPALSGWLRDLYQRVPDSIDLEAVKRKAFQDRLDLNPNGIVPLGLPDLWAPHDRDRFESDATAVRAQGTEDAGGGPTGAWVRGRSGFRAVIDAPEPGRYHLVLADNCPWCHRVALTRAVKGLDDDISVDKVFYRRDPDKGWQYRPDQPGFDADRLYGHRFVRELYEREGSKEKSVPVLFDKQAARIVSNESADIVRMLDDAWPQRGPRLAPPSLRPQIDRLNAWIYRDINNGAYKAGFTRSQAAYAQAYRQFFAALDRLEDILAEQAFLCGTVVTEADIRLFPTLFRLDPIYSIRFKLDKKLLRDYRHLPRWLSDMERIDGVRRASSIENSKRGYFGRTGNGLVPPSG